MMRIDNYTMSTFKYKRRRTGSEGQQQHLIKIEESGWDAVCMFDRFVLIFSSAYQIVMLYVSVCVCACLSIEHCKPNWRPIFRLRHASLQSIGLVHQCSREKNMASNLCIRLQNKCSHTHIGGSCDMFVLLAVSLFFSQHLSHFFLAIYLSSPILLLFFSLN